MSAKRAFLCFFFLLASGCISNLPEDGGPCPCGPGWICCETDGVCIRKGDMCLTGDQKLLVALEGTWIGTASDPHTMSGTNRIVMEMTLPATGEPTLGGLTGGIWFGEELDTRPADPDVPRIAEGYEYSSIRDGAVFTMLNMAIVNNRLMAYINVKEQWKDFCEAQTQIYYNEADDVYVCWPAGEGWWGEIVIGPNGEEGMIYHGPDGEEVLMPRNKSFLCQSVCVCNASSCAVDINQGPYTGDFDLSIDIDNGVLLGTSTEGRIDAVKQ